MEHQEVRVLREQVVRQEVRVHLVQVDHLGLVELQVVQVLQGQVVLLSRLQEHKNILLSLLQVQLLVIVRLVRRQMGTYVLI